MTPLGVRLLDQLRDFIPKQTREIQLEFKGLLTSKQDIAHFALNDWVRKMPLDMQREVETTKANLHILAMAPVLAWGYEQHWRKSIDLDIVVLRHRYRLDNLERVQSVETSTACLEVTSALMDNFPKPACEKLLAFWLDPQRPIWLPDRLQSSSILVSRQAGAWESLALMSAAYPGRAKVSSPSKRWAANLQACMAVMPTNVQALYIEHFLDSPMSKVDMIRGARCAHPAAWLKLSQKLLPLLPNNEWTRYDLLPACKPSASYTPDAAGRLNRGLAELYAPTLTQTLSALASDADWANPAFMRGLVDQTYRNQKGLPVPKQEAFELPADLDEGLFS